MNALVVGFSVEDTHALSGALRAAGHGALGALGRQGVAAFLASARFDVVAIPPGEAGVVARRWVEGAGGSGPFVVCFQVVGGVEALERAVGLRGDARGGEARGGEARGEEARGGEARGGEARGEEAQGEEARGGEARGGEARGGEVRGEEARGGEARGEEEWVGAFEERDPVGSGVITGTWERGSGDTGAGDAGVIPAPEADAIARGSPELETKLAQVRLGDYYAILEVEPEAPPFVVRERFERLSRRFSARGWPGWVGTAELAALAEVGRGLADALLILSEPELAKRYAQALAAAPRTSPESTAL